MTTGNPHDITTEERESARQYLLSTWAGVAGSLGGLSPSQLSFKPAPDRWSVAETTEHMALIANVVVQRVMAGIKQGPPPEPDVDRQKVEARIRQVATSRATKITAPAPFTPTGRWTAAESLAQLQGAHMSLIELLETRQDLRANTAAHPIIGHCDGYQWILLTGAHADRHLDQIREVKADPKFPAA
jgi:DinB superfamily